MARVVICFLVAAGLAAGCKSKIRAYEGQACSTTSDDDPERVCSPTQDLVCASSYSVPVTNPEQARRYDGGVNKVYVCRLVCDPGGEPCAVEDTICCPVAIHGKDYGKAHACVQPERCQTLARDAGPRIPPAPDAARTDSQPDTRPDAGPDAAPDATTREDGP